MKKHYRKENDCLNCGTLLEGKYCHNCGQENLELKENFGHMMGHAISDYFHFDHLFFHTLKPLLFKPGSLTNEYMAGRRVQYLHPIKMYIFISIIYFLLLFKSGHQVVTTNKATGKNPVNTQKMIDSVGKEINSAGKAIDKNTNLSAQQKKAIKERITKKGVVKITDYEKDERGPNTWFHPISKDTSYKQYIANEQKLPEEEQDGFLEKQWNKKTFDYREKYGPSAREVFLDELKHNTPKVMFLMLPLFALILRITFWKNKKYYVEHLIYTFHFHCFLFIFLGLLMLLQMIMPESWLTVFHLIKVAVIFYIMWYIYRSLRVVYHRSRFRTVTKIIGMSFMYFFALTFCICLLFFVTAII